MSPLFRAPPSPHLIARHRSALGRCCAVAAPRLTDGGFAGWRAARPALSHHECCGGGAGGGRAERSQEAGAPCLLRFVHTYSVSSILTTSRLYLLRLVLLTTSSLNLLRLVYTYDVSSILTMRREAISRSPTPTHNNPHPTPPSHPPTHLLMLPLRTYPGAGPLHASARAGQGHPTCQPRRSIRLVARRRYSDRRLTWRVAGECRRRSRDISRTAHAPVRSRGAQP